MGYFGIDVSEHNGSINWDAAKGNIDFAILRLGWIGNRENHTLDVKFEENYNECKRLGIPVGVYVYSYCKSSAAAQSGANWTVNNLSGKKLELPVYIDMEDGSTIEAGRDELTNICIAFNSIIEQTGRWAGVYANRNWFDNYLNKDEIKARYTTWIAHYGVDPYKYEGQYDMLQYSSGGSVSGISGRVDINQMYRDLINDINGSTPQPQPAPAPSKSIDELAQEVINGDWGNGQERIDRLIAAGYDYNAVQNRVNEILGASNEEFYTIKYGDTLSGISAKFGTSISQLCAWNNIANPNVIYAGDTIRVR